MNEQEREAWEDAVRWAIQPHTDVATLAVNYKTLRAVDVELKRLRSDLDEMRICSEGDGRRIAELFAENGRLREERE